MNRKTLNITTVCLTVNQQTIHMLLSSFETGQWPIFVLPTPRGGHSILPTSRSEHFIRSEYSVREVEKDKYSIAELNQSKNVLHTLSKPI
jgi:hypothetical protein